MSMRFLDDSSFVRESHSFIYRKHVVPPLALILVFLLCILFIGIVYSLIPDQPYLIVLASIFLFMVIFTAIYLLDWRYKNLINAVEFQSALFAGAARIATEFCLIARHDGKIVYIDPDYDHELFRLRNSKVRNIKTLLEVGEVNGQMEDNFLAALASGKSEKIPFKLPRKSRGGKALTLNLNPIDVPNDHFDGSNLTLSINPLSRPSGYSLLRVQQSEFKKEYEEYIDDFSVGFYAIKNTGEFSFISSYMEKTLGYTPGEIIADKVNISDLMFDQQHVKTFRSSKRDWQEVMVLRSRSNSPVHAFMNQSILRNNNGKIVGRHGIIMPLSLAAITSDESTSNKQQKSPDLIKYSPIATALVDKKGNVTDFNKSFRDLTNVSGNRKINLLELMTPEKHEAVKLFFTEVLSGKGDGTKPVDICIRVKDKDDKAASLYLNRVTDIYGQLQSIIAHMIDTTELKNLEMRFVHSQKMQAIGQLAGGIAHDFNNLLTAMTGFCDLLLMRHPAGDQSFADIMQIKQNATRAANLVKQLLAFSRKQTLQPEIINVTDALADLSNLIGRLIGENIELKITHGRDLKYVKVDHVQLEQVVMNLAVNARDAMPEGGELTITTSNAVIDKDNPINKSMIPPAEDEIIENGDYVLIEVSDTGVGINREIIGKIFEPFFSTKPIGAGTGLGLATVYGIVKQTGGYIYISSKIGKGTKFSIYLKGYDNKGATQPISPRAREESENAEVTDLTGTGNILLVEDETPVRIFSLKALTNKGYTVLDASCAEVALDIMKDRGKEIDVIITDVVMPGMSGPDMISKISEEYPDIKVIFISGYGEDAFIETYGTQREFNFLSKPYSLKQLVLKVKEVLAQRK